MSKDTSRSGSFSNEIQFCCMGPTVKRLLFYKNKRGISHFPTWHNDIVKLSRNPMFFAQFGQFLQHHLAFQPGQVIDEQYSFEMVHFML